MEESEQKSQSFPGTGTTLGTSSDEQNQLDNSDNNLLIREND
jgi:hypothetical protein